MNDVLATLASIPFAISVTALLRKQWPSINGNWVAVVVLVLTTLSAILAYYRDFIPVEVWIAAGPVIATILSLGTVQTLDHVVSKVGVSSRERPTVP